MQLIEALKLISSLKVALKVELVNLEESLNRISALNYMARYALPRFDNSAMDGYAVRVGDRRAKVVEVVLAGQESSKEVTTNHAIKVMTGAKIPKGTQAIVPIEEVKEKGEEIILPSNIKPNAHIRFKGEDVKEGEVILRKGEKITPYKIGVLASQGYPAIKVFKKPRVTIFASGSELKMYYQTLQGSQIYNSNAPSLVARCKELGCEVSFLGEVEDDLFSITQAIQDSLRDSDLIITSGGASVGDADFTKEAFKRLGVEFFFTKLAVKPGKPTSLGKKGDTFILSLPGNPLAAILNFELIGRSLINLLKGHSLLFPKGIKTTISQKIKLKKGRSVIVAGSFDGSSFHPFLNASPGMVTPASRMDGFIVSDGLKEELEGEVKFIPLWEFYTSSLEEILS